MAAIARLVRDRTECEDIAQEVFLRVYKNLAGFRGESSFYTWIFRIALNTAKNFLASNGRGKRSATAPRVATPVWRGCWHKNPLTQGGMRRGCRRALTGCTRGGATDDAVSRCVGTDLPV